MPCLPPFLLYLLFWPKTRGVTTQGRNRGEKSFGKWSKFFFAGFAAKKKSQRGDQQGRRGTPRGTLWYIYFVWGQRASAKCKVISARIRFGHFPTGSSIRRLAKSCKVKPRLYMKKCILHYFPYNDYLPALQSQRNPQKRGKWFRNNCPFLTQILQSNTAG